MREGGRAWRHPLVAALLLTWMSAHAADYEWNLPRGFPRPVVPADNPMSEAKVALGRQLFYESRLSVTGAYSCASCHRQELAFTDGRGRALGATGELHPRSAMSLANAGYIANLQWTDPSLVTLEAQASGPMLNEHPIEMGLKGRETEVLRVLAADAGYRAAFANAFPGETAPFTLSNVSRALASFQRTMISGRSAFDRRVFDDDTSAMSTAARRGMTLFYSERVGCARCHSGINFSGPVRHERDAQASSAFANTGLYNVDGSGRYPDAAAGLADATGRRSDHGRFRVPTLRNVAVTAPYMHDGSIATLEEVIDHYAQGGRQAPLGPSAGNTYRDERIVPFELDAGGRADLVEFLRSLTDETFLTDPKLSDPGSGAPTSVAREQRDGSSEQDRVGE
ncbi:MAG TPA: MbnH family di-heme enzyme [Steroidobacteraceae bacterium]|nr:MbnH family di-heme enzyme [Steroidobacteraceae bacterium]